jgi:hypothetical protein
MARTVNLPVLETELTDGGIVINATNMATDVVMAIGFSSALTTQHEVAGGTRPTYSDNPILLAKGDEADYIYGFAKDGSTLTQAVYELSAGGANRIYTVNLGKWNSAVFVDPTTEISYDLFSGTDIIDKEVYRRALKYIYGVLKNKTDFDLLFPVDAYAFDKVVVNNRSLSFAYDLAFHCFEMNAQNNEVIGIINVEPAASGTLTYVAGYVGTAPTKNTLGVITANGTGLLGEKEMAGDTSGLPGFIASNFANDSVNYGLPPLSDAEMLTDRKGNPVDIGKFIEVIAIEPNFVNAAFANDGTTTYTGPGGSAYAGLVSNLAPQSGPTNKSLGGVSGLRYKFSELQLDNLTQSRPDLLEGSDLGHVGHVTAKQTNRGVVVVDGASAARPASDYRRTQTMRIINAIKKVTRNIADPFIGEPNSDAMRASLKTSLDKAYRKFVGKGISQYDFQVIASSIDRVLGRMLIQLSIVPDTETRRIDFVVNMSSSL